MKTKTFNKRVSDLITEINHHNHKAELLQLMQDQLIVSILFLILLSLRKVL